MFKIWGFGPMSYRQMIKKSFPYCHSDSSPEPAHTWVLLSYFSLAVVLKTFLKSVFRQQVAACFTVIVNTVKEAATRIWCSCDCAQLFVAAFVVHDSSTVSTCCGGLLCDHGNHSQGNNTGADFTRVLWITHPSTWTHEWRGYYSAPSLMIWFKNTDVYDTI